MKKVWIQVWTCYAFIILGIVAMYIFDFSTTWKIAGYLVAGVLISINILVGSKRMKNLK